jgi:hypothetical protein
MSLSEYPDSSSAINHSFESYLEGCRPNRKTVVIVGTLVALRESKAVLQKLKNGAQPLLTVNDRVAWNALLGRRASLKEEQWNWTVVQDRVDQNTLSLRKTKRRSAETLPQALVVRPSNLTAKP